MASYTMEGNYETLCCEGKDIVVGEEMISLSAALWFQCMVALQIEFTMAAFDEDWDTQNYEKMCT